MSVFSVLHSMQGSREVSAAVEFRAYCTPSTALVGASIILPWLEVDASVASLMDVVSSEYSILSKIIPGWPTELTEVSSSYGWLVGNTGKQKTDSRCQIHHYRR